MILLIQFRTENTGPHDLKCVWQATGIPYNNFCTFNLFSPSLSVEALQSAVRKADRVIMSGSAETGYEEVVEVKKKALRAAIERLDPLVRYMVHSDKPLLGICFGANVIADVMGGDIVVDPELAEGGIVDIRVHKEGKSDTLLDGLGNTFKAISGHKSSIRTLPKQAVLLASSESTPVHAFKIGSHVYGTQFHPEMTYDDLVERLALYPSYSQSKSGSIERVDIHTHRVLRNFASQVG